jgi:hypothetical protein
MRGPTESAPEGNPTRTYLFGGEEWDITIRPGYYAECPQWEERHDRIGLVILGPYPTIDEAFAGAEYWTRARLEHGPHYMGKGR